MKKNKPLKLILHWLAVFAWVGVIYFFSAQPDLSSSLPTLYDFIFRKGAHVVIFFVLTYLLYRALNTHGLSLPLALTLAASIAMFNSLLDEYHQTYVAGRNGNPLDVLIDSFGTFLAVFIVIVEYRFEHLIPKVKILKKLA